MQIIKIAPRNWCIRNLPLFRIVRSQAKTPAAKPFHQRDGVDRKRRSISRSMLRRPLQPLAPGLIFVGVFSCKAKQ
jgi:hypothetical protein